jgi:hypothetical protein
MQPDKNENKGAERWQWQRPALEQRVNPAKNVCFLRWITISS